MKLILSYVTKTISYMKKQADKLCFFLLFIIFPPTLTPSVNLHYGMHASLIPTITWSKSGLTSGKGKGKVIPVLLIDHHAMKAY